MMSIREASHRVGQWLESPEPPTRLAAVRIGLAALLLIRLCRSTFIGVASQPKPLYEPISFMRAFDSMPGRTVVLAVQLVAIAGAALALAGIFVKVTLPAAWLGSVFLNGMLASMGKVVHNDVLLLLAVVPLLFAPSADVWAMRRPRAAASPKASGIYGFPVHAAMLVVAGAYFFAGLAKIALSGPSWVLSGNIRWALYASSDAQSQPNPFALFVADRPWLSVCVAAATLLLELSFPVVLFKPRLVPLFLAGALTLHTMIYMTMHLNYWPQAATVVVVLVNWPRVADRLFAASPADGSACPRCRQHPGGSDNARRAPGRRGR